MLCVERHTFGLPSPSISLTQILFFSISSSIIIRLLLPDLEELPQIRPSALSSRKRQHRVESAFLAAGEASLDFLTSMS